MLLFLLSLYLNCLKVGNKFQLSETGHVELWDVGQQLVQAGIQRLLEHQDLAVAGVLHQSLHELRHLEDLVHGLLRLLAVDRERDLLAGVGLLQVLHNLRLPLLQHRDIKLECLVDFIKRFLVLTRQPENMEIFKLRWENLMLK